MIVPPDQYYVRREPERSCADYWAARKDPDGVIRDRLSTQEEDQYIADVAEELAFVRSLEPFCILDVGCGPGWFLSAVQSAWKYGTERCRIAAAAARKRDIIVAEDTKQIADKAFDVVRCHHVIEHMEDPEAELEEMRRVCNDWLIISTPDFGSPCAARFGDNYRMLHDKTHCSLFTNESMHRFLRDGGFEVERVAYPYPLRYAEPGMATRWRTTSRVSPPWPGNWMTFYCRVN